MSSCKHYFQKFILPINAGTRKWCPIKCMPFLSERRNTALQSALKFKGVLATAGMWDLKSCILNDNSFPAWLYTDDYNITTYLTKLTVHSLAIYSKMRYSHSTLSVINRKQKEHTHFHFLSLHDAFLSALGSSWTIRWQHHYTVSETLHYTKLLN